MEAQKSLVVYHAAMLLRDGSVNYAQQGSSLRRKSHHALALYHKTRKDASLLPNACDFVALLKACTNSKDAKTGLQLHVDIEAQGLLEHNGFVSSTLVDMYAKCGLLSRAEQVFSRLSLQSVVAWTALIGGYAENGHGEKALDCFERMRLGGILPNAVTFVCGLKACSSLRAVERGLELHADIQRLGLLETDIILGNTLVDMYVKCGLLGVAHQVFDKLPTQNVISWNTLIAGYSEHGYGIKALNCLEQMQLEGVTPDTITLICSLKACGSVRAVYIGQDIHSEIERRKVLEGNLIISNALVEMYACCGLLAKAQQVFDKLSSPDVISWTALISGYAEHGRGERALECFEQMQLKGISPDSVAFVWILKACGSTKALGEGQELHAEIERRGLLERDLLIGNTVVDMYAKCGVLFIAREVFDTLLANNLVSWNSLIGGYVEEGLSEEALCCFEQMQSEGVSPDLVTFICILKACGSTGAFRKGQALHAEIERQGLLQKDVIIGNTLVDMYARCGTLAAAQEVCDNLPARNVVSWTALIKGYAEHGCAEEALECYERMQREGVAPNCVTFICALKACGSIGAKDKGNKIYMEVERRGLLETETVVGNTLVDMYARCGSLAAAQLLFDKLRVRDIVAWTALMAGYSQIGESENVFCTFDRMIEEGVTPSPITFIVVLRACSQSGAYAKSQTYFEAMSNDFGIAPGLKHHACVVDVLGRAGHLDKAIAMVKKIPFFPNLVVWHSVLGACGKWGNVACGNQAFEQAMCLDDTDTTAYVLMSHVYAAVGLQETAFQQDPTSTRVLSITSKAHLDSSQSLQVSKMFTRELQSKYLLGVLFSTSPL